MCFVHAQHLYRQPAIERRIEHAADFRQAPAELRQSIAIELREAHVLRYGDARPSTRARQVTDFAEKLACAAFADDLAIAFDDGTSAGNVDQRRIALALFD